MVVAFAVRDYSIRLRRRRPRGYATCSTPRAPAARVISAPRGRPKQQALVVLGRQSAAARSGWLQQQRRPPGSLDRPRVVR